ncbi:MAG: nodulation protein NfeD [Spirochaetia bacterium]|nr:nodulation protein NfeD [Spirochaetia bacterium]
MKSTLVLLFLSFAVILAVGELTAEKEPPPLVLRVEIKGAITPSTMDVLQNAVALADKRHAAALLVILDTPGGLAASMDQMVQAILSSKVPVITYVWPPGATCGSAGVYIMYASHIAAMSPATNIGSATPVMIGGGMPGTPGDQKQPGVQPDSRIPETAGADDAVNMKRKQIHHAVAQIQGLASFHGRNAGFAERTVTHADNVTSEEALRIGAIDLTAMTETELLDRVDGRTVRLMEGKKTVHTKGAVVERIDPTFRSTLLGILTNPNVAYILMMAGVLGLLAEIQYPGSIFPGVVGGLCLILGLYAMQSLPVNYAGLALIFLGVIFFILEIKVVSYGMLTVAGVISVVLGSVFLMKDENEVTRLSVRVILTVSVFFSGIMAFLIYKSREAMRRPPESGLEKLVTERGTVTEVVGPDGGRIFIHSELWSARSQGVIIPKNGTVRVVRKEGPVLIVEPWKD